MKYDAKLTNPKDHFGSAKLDLHLVPDSLIVYAAMGFLEGALKYGKYNWRQAGVRLSIYWSAFERHRMKFCAGEWADKKTGIPHLASMLCCIGIILDANLQGKLTDDRPPAQPILSDFIDHQQELVARLKHMFKDHNPHQHTIMDAAVTDDTRRPSKGRRKKKAARR